MNFYSSAELRPTGNDCACGGVTKNSAVAERFNSIEPQLALPKAL